VSDEWCGDLARVIESAYDVPGPVSCRFMRSGFNQHFRAEAGDETFHVRLYFDGNYYIRGDDDFRCELALTRALAEAGCPVAAPIARRDGQLLTVGEIDGRPRRLAMLAMAPGEPCSEPTTEQAATIGRAVAAIHATANEVAPTLPGDRYHLDERYLLTQPLAQLRRAAGDAPELDRLQALGAELSAVLASLPKDDSDYGLIHADFHLGNMHFSDDGELTIFDFDHCAYGWRAYDLTTLRLSLADDRWAAALEAYAATRPLPPGVELIDDLVRMRILWDIGDILAMEDVWGNDDASRQVREALPKLCLRLGLPEEPQSDLHGSERS